MKTKSGTYLATLNKDKSIGIIIQNSHLKCSIFKRTEVPTIHHEERSQMFSLRIVRCAVWHDSHWETWKIPDSYVLAVYYSFRNYLESVFFFCLLSKCVVTLSLSVKIESQRDISDSNMCYGILFQQDIYFEKTLKMAILKREKIITMDWPWLSLSFMGLQLVDLHWLCMQVQVYTERAHIVFTNAPRFF